MQLTYLMENRLKNAVEEVDKEKALKDVAKATVKEKVTATKNAEELEREAERARVQDDQQRVEA